MRFPWWQVCYYYVCQGLTALKGFQSLVSSSANHSESLYHPAASDESDVVSITTLLDIF